MELSYIISNKLVKLKLLNYLKFLKLENKFPSEILNYITENMKYFKYSFEYFENYI